MLSVLFLVIFIIDTSFIILMIDLYNWLISIIVIFILTFILIFFFFVYYFYYLCHSFLYVNLYMGNNISLYGGIMLSRIFSFFFFLIISFFLDGTVRSRECVCMCAGHRRKLLRAWVTLRDSRGSLLSALDDRGRSPAAWAFESRRWSEHVTISVLGIGATGSSILSFLTSTSRRAFASERFGLLSPSAQRTHVQSKTQYIWISFEVVQSRPIRHFVWTVILYRESCVIDVIIRYYSLMNQNHVGELMIIELSL